MLARTDRLDRAAVATLREMTDMGYPDFLGEVISLFLDTFSGQLAELFQSVERNDIDDLRRISRDLTLSSRGMGAVVLAACCGELEAQARHGGMRGTAAPLARIVEEFKAVRPELEGLLSTA